MQSPTPANLVPVRRALLSVSDKAGLIEFATALVNEFKVQLVSTGGTATYLRDAGLSVTDVSEVTGFPEMMDGRVKTLHPKVHGGLLALRDHKEHLAAMWEHGIEPIDLLCVNLYPFKKTIEKPDVSFEEAVENIDIGGPAMIRSAAKNHAWVVVVTAPDRYEKILGDLRKHDGKTCLKHRQKQAQSAFAHTAEYDALIAKYLARQVTPEVGVSDSPNDRGVRLQPPPVAAEAAHPGDEQLHLLLSKKQDLRYGENPHQKAALYVDRQPAEASVAYATQHHGKELSYINLLDADGALSCVKEFTSPAACIVKHTTPCGCATATDLPTAFKNAYAGDPLAAFGGIVALNRTIDLATAEAITSIDKLLEVVVAPSYADDALELLKTRWKNVRLLSVGFGTGSGSGSGSGSGFGFGSGTGSQPVSSISNHGLGAHATQDHGPAAHAIDPHRVQPRATADPEFHLHKIVGGYLVQERDLLGLDESTWKIASARQPTEAEMADLRFAWLVCKHVKSNAIVLARDQMLLGAGAGQMDRPSAARLAIEKAGGRAAGAVAASDAFFPFPDGPKLLLDAGVTAIIHPGGSLKDQETIDLINARGAALVLTGQRHFKH